MHGMTIVAQNISKKFGEKTIFKNICFCASPSHSIAITGPNGSGKSTLLEIIAGIRKPSEGVIIYQQNGHTLPEQTANRFFGFLSPRLRFYDELTAAEIVETVAKNPEARKRGFYLITELGLSDYYHMRIGKFSTGMIQRLKIALSLINDPLAILLDEPSANLDAKGKEVFISFLKNLIPYKTIIIATNEEHEAALCTGRIALGS
ncbi:MAG: ABC transporter ATP-binding protein [Spirochaetes bacterium]|nr:ABC transporter ATP-binding protein [Spirochaetota bacterium]